MPVSHRFEKTPGLIFWTSVLGGSGVPALLLKYYLHPSTQGLHPLPPGHLFISESPASSAYGFHFRDFSSYFNCQLFRATLNQPVQLIPASRKESVFLAVVGWEASCLKQSIFFLTPALLEFRECFWRVSKMEGARSQAPYSSRGTRVEAEGT